MADTYLKYYPAVATLAETRRACETEQTDPEPDPKNPDNDAKPSQLVKLEGVIHDKDGGAPEKLNEATFKKADSLLDVLDELLFFDVSTAQGAADAAVAGHDHTQIGGPGVQFQIWVNNKLTPVVVMGKTT
jgi:hypothetical protein